MNIHPIVKQIIDRDCHISWSIKHVCKYVVSKLKGGHATFRKLPKKHRRRLLKECAGRHRENFLLYRDVTSGSVGKPNAMLLPIEELIIKGSLTGEGVCRLMRLHKMTIKRLSSLMGVTMKRIREMRESGLSDPFAIRDWIEAITGSDPGAAPEKFRISGPTEECLCDYCRCPIFSGESAYLYVNKVFCSRTCISEWKHKQAHQSS